MTNKNALKVTPVLETKNNILKPNTNELFLDIIDQVASLFTAGPYYYYITNFEQLKIDYVHEGISAVLGLKPSEFNLNKLFEIMHPDDLECMYKKEALATNILFKQLSTDQLKDYKVVYLMRLKHTNGNYKTILHQTNIISTSIEGKAQQVIVIHTDVTYLNIRFDNNVSFISNKHTSYHYKYSDLGYGLIDSFESIFTKRETEIIKLLIQGKKANEISKLLYISLLTVNTHKRNILKKSKCKNSYELIATSIRNGLF